MNLPRKLFSALGLVLVAAVGLQIWAVVNQPAPRTPPELESMIPASLPGWTMRELPLGETEETRNAVASTLQFDRFISRVYTRGAQAVTVYIAYWQPGKVPPRAVGVHTPDTCWIQNGWSCNQRVHAISLALPDGRLLKPAESGVYSLSGMIQHVYFWHLVGDRVYAYEQEGLHALSSPILDTANFGLHQRQEQLFVRIAANVPWTQIWTDPGIRDLVSALGMIGLAAEPSSR